METTSQKFNFKTIANSKTMKTTIKTLSLAAMALFVMTSCDDDDPVEVNEEETITTVELTLTNSTDPTDVVVLSSIDGDGDGPDPASQTISGPLTANASYDGNVRFLNELESPAEDITVEVRAEADEHEIFYATSIAGVTVTKDDLDGNGNLVGLETTVTTGAAGTGTMTVTLRHEPIKPNDGTLSGAGGETDVQVIFTGVTIQ